MKLQRKKVNPQDVFISALNKDEQKWREFSQTDIPAQKNRPSGNEFIDLLAELISVNFMRSVGFYASKFNMEIVEFNYFMKFNSDLSFNQWRNQYILLAAKELLTETDYSHDEIGKRLGFTGAKTFSAWFVREDNDRPSWLRRRAKRKAKTEAEKAILKEKAMQTLAKYSEQVNAQNGVATSIDVSE